MGFLQVVLIICSSLLAVAGIVFLIWVFLAAPSGRGRYLEKYKSVRFAHRGLHGNGVAENSMTAFRLAVESGYGIELDIRLSADGELVVYHDADLLRVSGINKKVCECTLEELSHVRLCDTCDTVPAFSDVLRLISGRVPLLIEIKSDVDESGVAEKFIEAIAEYSGEYIVESFNPLALRTVKKHRPDVIVGILSMEYMKENKYRGKVLYRFLERLRLNFLARPDFIAYDKRGYRVFALRLIKRLFDTPLFAWTVRCEDEEKEARMHGFDTVIFEGYRP